MLALARTGFDLGLFTNGLEAQLHFWQQEVGLAYDHLGKLGGGIHQHRHHLHGAVLKLNAARDPLPPLPPSGYLELHIVDGQRQAVRRLEDPDGNSVLLVPPHHGGTRSVDIMLGVRDVAAHTRFFGTMLGLPSDASGAFLVGEARIRLQGGHEIARSADWRGPGFRYLTLQVTDARATVADVTAAGVELADPLRDLGALVRFAFIRDPDGNFIELSERTSYTGRPLR